MRAGRIVLSLFFVLLLVSACSNLTDEKIDQSPSSTKEELFPPEKKASIFINNQAYPMEKGGYQWERKKGSQVEIVTTDHASINQMAEKIEPIRVDAMEVLSIRFEDEPNYELHLWNETGREQEISVENNQFTAPVEKGIYVYEVFATWENGERSFAFVLEIQ
ncbi:MAG: hypothetical protein ABS944_17580 [Solibacillus sp.]|uniref:hypothetical protein n=1 Tax=unclassified Solibacillus TaxID=2637870 RepID=UPI0030F91124